MSGFSAWDEAAAGRNFTGEDGVPINLLLEEVPTRELDVAEDPHTREMTFAWEISTIALILVLLISPQTSYVWQNTERFVRSNLVSGSESNIDGCFLIYHYQGVVQRRLWQQRAALLPHEPRHRRESRGVPRAGSHRLLEGM